MGTRYKIPVEKIALGAILKTRIETEKAAKGKPYTTRISIARQIQRARRIEELRAIGLAGIRRG
jgi:hypothetical protein